MDTADDNSQDEAIYGVFYREGEGPRYEDENGRTSFTWAEACKIAQQIDGGITKVRK